MSEMYKENQEVRIACQHSGAYGPWYHVSVYVVSNGKLKYKLSKSGHYRRGEIPELPTLSEAKANLLNHNQGGK